MALSAVLLVGCGGNDPTVERLAETAFAVSGGVGDIDSTAVLGVMITDGAGEVARTCSGALISPNLMITAQHCIASTADFVFCDESSFGPPVSPSQVFVTTATSMWDGDTVWRMAREVRPPPGGSDVCGRDVALVVVDDVVGPDEAVPLAPALDRPVQDGESYSAIGFGETSQDYGDGGYRRRRDGLTVDCVGGGCDAPTYVDAREWRGPTGICDGDSGGPAIDDSGAVIGITSRGPLGCEDPIYGGLAGWRGWIREVGVHAATVGDYPPPAWIDGTTAETSAALLEELAADGSCSARAGARPNAAAAALIVGFLLARAARRRRWSKLRRPCKLRPVA